MLITDKLKIPWQSKLQRLTQKTPGSQIKIRINLLKKPNKMSKKKEFKWHMIKGLKTVMQISNDFK